MSIGTARYLPLGITTDDRWGAAGRRRLVAICAICALAVAGFVIAETAHGLMTPNSADIRTDGVSPGTAEAPVKLPGVPPATENFESTATLPAAEPIPEPSSPSPAVAIEPPTVPAAVLEAPSAPTVLRGAGVKRR